MSLLAVLLMLGVALALRVGFLAVHLNNLEGLWADYARRGFVHRLARIVDLVTFIVFCGCAIYMLWTLPADEASVLSRFTKVFVAWFGVALLERLAVHRFPRTNAPVLYFDAQMNLASNVVTAVAGGLAMTGVTALYYWLRGG